MLERIQQLLISVDQATAAGVIYEGTSERFKKFLKSIRTQVTTGRTLSPGQNKYLVDIENTCSDDNIEEANKWSESYDDDLREVAVICAEYYENSPEGQHYFKKIRTKVLENRSGHVLSKNEFNKMCCNKYAVNVINELKSKPRFSTGQIVQIRSVNRLDMAPYSDREKKRYAYKLQKMGEKETVLAMVVKVNSRTIYRPISGGKVYTILPIGTSIPVYACEKDLKFPKGLKK